MSEPDALAAPTAFCHRGDKSEEARARDAAPGGELGEALLTDEEAARETTAGTARGSGGESLRPDMRVRGGTTSVALAA